MKIKREAKLFNVYRGLELEASFSTLEQARSFLALRGNVDAAEDLDRGIINLFGEYDHGSLNGRKKKER